MKKIIFGLLIVFLIMCGTGWYYTIYLPQQSLDLLDPDENSTLVIDEISKQDIQQMLRNKEYDKLNKVLARAQGLFLHDVSREDNLYMLYDSFASHDPAFESLLDEWVAQYPDKYQPYLARAFHNEYMGWESRDYDWAENTKEEQFKQMISYFKNTDMDVQKALHINSKLIFAYFLIISMNSSVENPTSHKFMNIALQKALAINPYTFRIRVAYIIALEPRWGGSYEQMDAFATDAQKYADTNPELKILQGFSYYDKGRVEYHNKNYQAAMELYTQALSFGEYSRFYEGRSNIYYRFRKYNDALLDIERAIILKPNIEEYYTDRALIYYALGDMKQCVNDLSIAEATKPDDIICASNADWILGKILKEANTSYAGKQYRKAIEKYDLILSVNARKYNEVYYWRGMAYTYLKDYRHAAEDIQKATELFPKNYEYYTTLDWVLAQSRNWDAITTAWGRYIAANPNDSNGYLQRGGAYFHKGDYESAMLDAKKSAELGNAEGQIRYEQMAKKLGK